MKVKNLLTSILGFVFLLESPGVYLPSIIQIDKDALRPMASAVSSKTKDSFSPPVKRYFKDILGEYKIRNSRYNSSDTKEKVRLRVRLESVVKAAKDVSDFLAGRLKDKKIISIMVLGDYLYNDKPSDMDIFIITEGKDELDILDGRILEGKRPGPAGVEWRVVSVGYDRLEILNTWKLLNYARRGYCDGIAISGTDPYQHNGLYNGIKDAKGLDDLLNHAKILVEHLEEVEIKDKSTLDSADKSMMTFLARKIEEATDNAIEVFRKIANNCNIPNVAEKLDEIARGRRFCKTPKDYYLKVREIYDGLEKESLPAPARYLPGVSRSWIHCFFAEHWQEVTGKTPDEILEIFAKYGKSVSLGGIKSFLKKNKIAAEFYGVREEKPEWFEEASDTGVSAETIKRLKTILNQHSELERADEPEMLLKYLDKHEQDLLKGMPKRHRLKFLAEFLFLGYETRPLPEKLLEKLPRMAKDGQRLAAIRLSRGIKTHAELARMTGLTAVTCRDMEYKTKVGYPGRLSDVTKALKIDPIYVLYGRHWKDVSAEASDADKMYICRFRKGWPQQELVDSLEKAGFKFATDSVTRKLTTVSELEQGKRLPASLEQRDIIRKVLGEKTLFENATEAIKANTLLEPDFLPGVRRSAMHLLFAKYRQEIIGKTSAEILEIFAKHNERVTLEGIRDFLRRNKTAAEFYKVKKGPGPKKVEKKSEAKREPVTKHRFIAKDQLEPVGRMATTPPESDELEEPEGRPESQDVELGGQETETDIPETLSKKLTVAPKTRAALGLAKDETEDIKADYAVFNASDVLELLKSDPELLEEGDIEYAIDLLQDSLGYIRKTYEAMAEKRKKPILWTHIEKRYQDAITLLSKLQEWQRRNAPDALNPSQQLKTNLRIAQSA